MSDTAVAVRSVAGGGFSQTGFMFGAILFAFIVFITMRGDLAKWLGVFGLAGSASGSTSSTATLGTSSTQGVAQSIEPNWSLPSLPALPSISTGAGSGLTLPASGNGA